MDVNRMKTIVWEQPSHPEGKRLLEARLKYFPIAHQKGGGKWGTRARQGVGVGDVVVVSLRLCRVAAVLLLWQQVCECVRSVAV